MKPPLPLGRRCRELLALAPRPPLSGCSIALLQGVVSAPHPAPSMICAPSARQLLPPDGLRLPLFATLANRSKLCPSVLRSRHCYRNALKSLNPSPNMSITHAITAAFCGLSNKGGYAIQTEVSTLVREALSLSLLATLDLPLHWRRLKFRGLSFVPAGKGVSAFVSPGDKYLNFMREKGIKPIFGGKCPQRKSTCRPRNYATAF